MGEPLASSLEKEISDAERAAQMYENETLSWTGKAWDWNQASDEVKAKYLAKAAAFEAGWLKDSDLLQANEVSGSP